MEMHPGILEAVAAGNPDMRLRVAVGNPDSPWAVAEPGNPQVDSQRADKARGRPDLAGMALVAEADTGYILVGTDNRLDSVGAGNPRPETAERGKLRPESTVVKDNFAATSFTMNFKMASNESNGDLYYRRP